MSVPLLTMGTKYREQQRLRMVEGALKEKAPKTYLELKRAGKLKAFVQKQEKQMISSYERESMKDHDRFLTEKLPKGQSLSQALHETWHRTMETFLDFSDPPPEEGT